jgi:5-methyltetrahydropteroyltriglutamate--homocysteine methyltransferase
MKRSTEHILTTHTGSLPRPPALVEGLQLRDHGGSDGAALEEQIRDAVVDVVRRQAQAGVGVVNDGEASKIGYSTYVKERLDGFGGEGVCRAWVALLPPSQGGTGRRSATAVFHRRRAVP